MSANQTVKADYTTTYTFSSLSYDGYLYNFSSSYTTARTNIQGTLDSSSNSMHLGQTFTSDLYYIYRNYLYFSTSIIPSYAVITEAILSLYITNNSSDTDFNVTIQIGKERICPHIPLDTTDYYYNSYEGNGGSRNTTEITGTGYWNITITSLSWIEKTGITKFCLRSSNDINSIAPTGTEKITVSSSEAGELQAPKLYVTYTISGEATPTVLLHGPYLETGMVYNGTITVVVSFAHQESETHILNGTDGNAEDLLIISDELPINVYWNLTTDYTKQRVYFFTVGNVFEEVWLYVANTTGTEILSLYYISVTDFAGLTNGYVLTTKNVAGYTRTIEKQRLDVMNNMPFWLITYTQYSLKIISDQGTFTWNLPADAIGTKTFLVTKDMVSQASTARNFTVSATRVNGSIINIRYYDPTSSTISVKTDMLYYANYQWNTAYTQTDYGNNLDFNWTDAEPARDYVVNITATFLDKTLTWQFGVAAPAPTNIFGISLNLFGNWPFPVNQLPGLFIAGLFFALFSWRDTEAGCAVGLIVTGLLTLFGFLEVPVMGLAMGFMLVIFMFLHKGKETLRYPP